MKTQIITTTFILFFNLLTFAQGYRNDYRRNDDHSHRNEYNRFEENKHNRFEENRFEENKHNRFEENRFVNEVHNHTVSGCEQVQYQERIPGYWTKKFVPAEYRCVRTWDARTRRYVEKQVLVRAACYQQVFVPDRYETKTKWVCRTTPICETPRVETTVVIGKTCSCQTQFISGYQSCGTPTYSYTVCKCKKQPVQVKQKFGFRFNW